MARGSEAKDKRKEARKEQREKEKEEKAKLLEEVQNDFELNMDADFPTPGTKVADDVVDINITEGDATAKPMKKKKRKKSAAAAAAAGGGGSREAPSPASQGIKSGPLIMLLMLTGTTLLPALLYAGDWFGSFIQKNHILGSLGHKLNIGSSPKKRVLSFYEKHDPNKLGEVETILAKYYGDYPTLIKRLERKYGDYGYFLNWEQDEAPSKLAFEKLEETKQTIQKEFNKRAPQSIKTAVRNISYNLSTLYRKGRVVWKKKVWPLLEPVFGVPDAKAAREQKKKDRNEAMKKKGRRKANTEYRDDEF